MLGKVLVLVMLLLMGVGLEEICGVSLFVDPSIFNLLKYIPALGFLRYV